MRKPIFTFAMVCAVAFGFTACSGEDSDANEENTEQEMDAVDNEKEEEEPQEEVSQFGNFEGLIGNWTVDAATAGVKVDLTFGEDGSFKQEMGAVKGEGTWQVIDDERINIITQNTNEEGQNCVIKNLTENSVDLVWNPDAANPKTLPLKRAE